MDEDLAAIRQVIADADKLQSDAEGFAALLTDDVVLVNFGGRRVVGRDQVRAAMAEALATPMADVRTSIEIADVHLLSADVALVSTVKQIFDEREPAAAEPLRERGWSSFVLVRRQRRWLVALVQTTPVVS